MSRAPDPRALIAEARAARPVVSALAEAGVDGDDPDYAELLRTESDLPAALDAMALSARLDEARADATRAVGRDVSARADREALRAKRKREAMRAAMEEAGLTKLDGVSVTLSLVAGRPGARVVDAAALPERLVKLVREPDAAAINAAVLAGEDVPGAVRTNPPPTLTIRSR